jgi:hypothetical protein
VIDFDMAYVRQIEREGGREKERMREREIETERMRQRERAI